MRTVVSVKKSERTLQSRCTLDSARRTYEMRGESLLVATIGGRIFARRGRVLGEFVLYVEVVMRREERRWMLRGWRR